MVFYKQDLNRLSFLKMVQLGEKGTRQGEWLFTLISQGVKDIKYTSQAEILKQTQHIIILCHSSEETAKAKNKYQFKKSLEELMRKKPIQGC